MARTSDHSILCSFEWRRAIYVRRSADEGTTWDDPVKVADYPFGAAANPELLVMQNGTVLLSYNERPADGAHPYTIRICFSRDNGRTWGDNTLVYEAGMTSGTGCWEPVQIQLPSGEIDLFFSNEQPYPLTNEQEISVVRSFDGGGTWSVPERASFRPAHRDGMPVPLLLNNSNLVVSIEDNGMAGTFKPAVAPGAGTGLWSPLITDGATPRWQALETQLPSAVYAGAPYVRQLPSGETVLSVQSAAGRRSPGTLDFSRMVVYVGDSQAKNFTNPTEPFSVPPEANGLWNSLFIKNGSTVTAISATTIGGVTGIWTIDGRLVYSTASNDAAIQRFTGIAGRYRSTMIPGPVHKR